MVGLDGRQLRAASLFRWEPDRRMDRQVAARARTLRGLDNWRYRTGERTFAHVAIGWTSRRRPSQSDPKER